MVGKNLNLSAFKILLSKHFNQKTTKMYHQYFFIRLRSVSRRLGITKIINRLFSKKDYEKLFRDALVSHIHNGDVIYDIGANRGFYTKIFLELTPLGKVFAFEPVPACYQIISELQSNYKNLFIYQIALGSNNGVSPMSICNDDLNATSYIKKIKDEGDILVNIETLDEVVAKNRCIPNVLKIDVEGSELEVLKGMATTIKNKLVNIIAMEVHFKILEDNGFKDGSISVVNILKQNGFKINWVDPSHIIAIRGR
jgi:FkbM family methyltransferase